MLGALLICAVLGWVSAGIPGGRTPADINSPDVKSIASFAIFSLNQLGSRNSNVNLLKVVKAERQVVAGINYYLELEVIAADCVANCQASEICHVTIFDQEWTKTRELSHFYCKAAQTKRKALLGGLQPISSDAEEVKNAAQFAVTELNSRSNSLFANSLLTVKTATSQVVAGIRYNLEIEIGQTSCRNTQTVDLKQCQPNGNAVSTCLVSVLWQAWSKPQYTLLDGFKCEQ